MLQSGEPEIMTLREDADFIISESIRAVLPDEAVRKALAGKDFGSGRVLLLSIGKAGWEMAETAAEILEGRISDGLVITKYGHVKRPIPGIRCLEAGHPVPDGNSFLATQQAMKMVQGLAEEDTVIFLISGGGSALFEKPLVPPEELADLTRQLLASGADIREMNTIRKRLSAVKGGRFAMLCRPAKIFCIVLSDIVGDPPDMIASGPASPDSSTSEEAEEIVRKYGLKLSAEAKELLKQETPKSLDHVETIISGSVRELCRAGAEACRQRGYEPVILTDCMTCEAKEAGSFLASAAKTHQDVTVSTAFLAGGETVVHLNAGRNGRGGRNQELALSAAEGIAGCRDTAVFSVGSDGTDGPTDAAGGYADGETWKKIPRGEIASCLARHDSFGVLEKTGGLIVTGPTGTNVNDLAAVLIRR